MSNRPSLGFIGFGEAGQAFARGLGASGLARMAAYDLRGAEPDLRDAAERLGVRMASDPADAIEGADFIFSAVPPPASLDAARSVAGLVKPGQIFVDINSVSPEHKREAAGIVGEAAYLDVALIGPVQFELHATPCLAAGRGAARLIEALVPFGMRIEDVGEEIGNAALIRMTRSIVVKGLEALVYECLATARAAGVEKSVLKTLAWSWPGIDWPELATHHLERMLRHGVRRAAELREVAATVEEFGLDAHMARAAIEHEERLGQLPLVLAAGDLGDMLDRIRIADSLHPARLPDPTPNGTSKS